MNNNWPPHSRFFQWQNKRLLGIDYGEKVTGISLFSPGVDPFPLMGERLIFKDWAQLILDINDLIDNESIDAIIIGLPYLTDGTATEMTKKIETFSEKLKEKVQIPVFFQDETLTTYEAENRMKNSPQFNFTVDKKQIDNLCAVIIIEEFLKTVSVDD